MIPQYKRSMKWAWQQWEFTITERLWKAACSRMVVPLCLLLFTHWSDPTLSWWHIPSGNRLAEPFRAFATGWNYILTLATFVLTFFVGHAHDFWRKSYGLTRSVQGRLNDIGLMCGSHTQRVPGGELSDAATRFLHDTARNLRLLQCLFYADVCYRRAAHAGREGTGSIRLLLSFDRVARNAPGLERLRHRGLVTDLEYETLVGNGAGRGGGAAQPPARCGCGAVAGAQEGTRVGRMPLPACPRTALLPEASHVRVSRPIPPLPPSIPRPTRPLSLPRSLRSTAPIALVPHRTRMDHRAYRRRAQGRGAQLGWCRKRPLLMSPDEPTSSAPGFWALSV